MTVAPTTQRLRAVDYVRGLACVLMAIDHVRVYSGLPAGGPTADIFLTRWVTHFVAPAFALLAGTGAWFYGRRHGVPALRRFLVSRGLLLIALELTVIRVLWASYWSPSEFTLAGVIWMLGWCMVLLAALAGLGARMAGIVGVAIIALQQLFGAIGAALPESLRPWYAFLYPSGAEPAHGVNVLYVLVPWIGVMLAGYALGSVLERPDDARHRWFTRVGIAATVLFLVLSTAAAVAFPGEPDHARPLWMRILDQQKYPASQLFLLMTLGPTLWLMPYAERARGRVADAMVTFGRVPMFYYLSHLVVIHAAALMVNLIRTGAAHGEWYTTAPYASVPDEGRWNLPLLYLVFAVAIGVLYPACRWYARQKAAHPDSWMRYL